MSAEEITVIDCGDVFVAASVADMYTRVLSYLAEGHFIQFNVSKIEYIDSATMQMIYAFSKEARRQGHVLLWEGASEAFVRSAKLLGLAALDLAPQIMADVARGTDEPESKLDAGQSKAGWRIDFRPHRHLFQTGNDPVNMFRELDSLGDLSVEIDDDELPPFVDLEPEDSYLKWILTLRGDTAESDVMEIFAKVDLDCDLVISPLSNDTVKLSSEVQSKRGDGAIFTIQLPLTLATAIMDGQIIRVADENYIIPLISIIETLEIKAPDVKRVIAQGELYRLADEYLPIIRLYSVFNVTPKITDLEAGLLLIIEDQGQKFGLFIDDLLGQQQIVIKSLETNYRKVLGVSGATILGDGTVALILDVSGVMALYRDPSLAKIKLNTTLHHKDSNMSELQTESDALGLIAQKEYDSEQYLTFSLDDEEYGVDILRVQEIKGWDRVSHVPNSPHYLCGVLNLRGTIVPVVDLRLLFGMPALAYTSTTVVVVLKVNGPTQRTVGIVVDAVSDAHAVLPEDIKPAPDFGSSINTDFISGLVSIDDNMTILLNIDSLLSVEALG